MPYDEIYLAEDGQQIGPLTEAQVREMVMQGRANEQTYAWVPGAPDWQPAGQVIPELFAMTIAVSADQIKAPAAAPQPEESSETVYAPAPEPEPEPEPEVAAEQDFPQASYDPEPAFEAEAVLEPEPEPEPEPVFEPEPGLEPEPVLEPEAAPAAAASQPPTTSFDVEIAGDWRVPSIHLEDDTISLAPGALHYAQGQVAISWPIPSSDTPAAAPRFPVCRGTGRVVLAPSAGECTVLELNGEEWLVDPEAFLACDYTVSTEARVNSSWSGPAGEQIFEVHLSGRGKALLRAQGAVERVELRGDSLIVNGRFAVARTGGVELALDTPADDSGVPLRTYRGNGTVLLAPLPRRS